MMMMMMMYDMSVPVPFCQSTSSCVQYVCVEMMSSYLVGALIYWLCNKNT